MTRVPRPRSGERAQSSMALKSTICKAELAVADIDRGYYGNHAVTLARHPSQSQSPKPD